MASQKMTFTIQSEVAAQLLRRVPARQRSRYVAEAVREKLAAHDMDLLRSCEAANRNKDVENIEKEFDAIASSISEPWEGRPARRASRRPTRRRRSAAR